MTDDLIVSINEGKMPLKEAIMVSEFTNHCWALKHQTSPQISSLVLTSIGDLGSVALIYSTEENARRFIETDFMQDAEKIRPESISLPGLVSTYRYRIDTVLLDLVPVGDTTIEVPAMRV